MKYFTPVIIVVVGVAVIAGFFVAGSPARQREERFDQKRLSDLQYLQSMIVDYWQNKNKLPDTLASLNDTLRGVTVSNDPQSGQPYEYQVKTTDTFVLCANFSLSSQGGLPAPSYPALKNPYMGDSSNWDHAAGHACFERTIDRDFFKPANSFAPNATD